MDLSMYREDVFQRYKSNSQRARVLTEGWFASEMYCPCCLNRRTEKDQDNQRVYDFLCRECTSKYQLKSFSKPLTGRIVDGEYHTMHRFVSSDLSPNFILLHYSRDDWHIRDLLFVPRFFISTSIIERREPLRSTARRHGWTGCNLLLNRIPEDGRIAIVKRERQVNPRVVNEKWKRMSFLNKKRPHLRGWTSDVLKCVEELASKEFTLNEAYGFKDYLQELHPDNRYVEAKIRQQLQVLRDNGIVRFVSPGKYQLLR